VTASVAAHAVVQKGREKLARWMIGKTANLFGE
jgi:hypothetical protein